MLITSLNSLSPGQQTLKSRSGTAWLQSESRGVIGSVLEYEQQAYAQRTWRLSQAASMAAIDRLGDVEFVAYCEVPVLADSLQFSQAGQVAIRLPADVLYVNSIELDRQRLDNGSGYHLDSGYLILDTDFPIRKASQFVMIGVQRLSRNPLDFWSHPLQYREHLPNTWRFMRALHRCQQQAACWHSLCELLAAAVDAPCVSKAGRVIEILESDDLPPTVVTTAEMLVGKLGDLPTVDLGQLVAPGDFVFDSIRFHNFQESLPVWLNQLTIAPNYFDAGSGVTSPLTISSATLVPADVQTTGQLIHVKLPWTGDAVSQDNLFAYGKQLEISADRSLAAALLPQLSATQWETTELNWLAALWSTWLRHGASVSLIRDKPTPDTLRRLSQVRRVIPPWTTHFIQFLQPEDNQAQAFC